MRASAVLKNPVALSFFLCFAYWAYLLFASTPYIKYDAETFVALGISIYQNGFTEFFKAEPNYVPLYPLLIATSLRIAEAFSLSYQCVQIAIQIAILLTTQFLMLRILQALNVRRSLIAVVVLYFGISPAMINSTFSLYSEIVTYPFVLWSVMAAVNSWQIAKEGSWPKMILSGLGLILPFFLATMANAVFEYIFTFLLFSYFVLACGYFLKNKLSSFVRIVGWVAVVFFLFQAALLPYRSMNLKYNGHKSLVIKGAWSLYANTQRRTENLTPRQFLVALAHVPGEGVCSKFFTDQECFFWSIEAQHGKGVRKLEELRAQGVPNDRMDSLLISLSQKMAFQKPLQYALLTLMEGAKMFFWESTRIGYVFYPAWLTEIYNVIILKNGLRLLLFLLTLSAFIFLLCSVWQNKKDLYEANDLAKQCAYLFFLSIIMAVFISLHAFFCIATRYTFPIVSLYLISIAYTYDKILFKKSKNLL